MIEMRFTSVYHTHVHVQHTVDHSQEISTFQHSPEFIMPHYTRIIYTLDRVVLKCIRNADYVYHETDQTRLTSGIIHYITIEIN